MSETKNKRIAKRVLARENEEKERKKRIQILQKGTGTEEEVSKKKDIKDLTVSELSKIIQEKEKELVQLRLHLRQKEDIENKKVIYVSTIEEGNKHCKAIKTNHTSIALDCEGVDLGRQGTLCLIQIATPDKELYLFDTLVEPRLVSLSLKEILESKTLLKITHDCRRDSDALFHCKEAHVTLTHVFDTQIAYAFFCIHTLRPIPIPISLNALMSKFLHSDAAARFSKLKHTFKSIIGGDSLYWMKRPLDEFARSYALHDVYYLHFLREQLSAPFPSEKVLKDVLDYSQVYCQQVRDREDGISKDKQTHQDYPTYGIESWDIFVDSAVRKLKDKQKWRSF